MELKIRVKEYRIYGDDDEYVDITFESNKGEEGVAEGQMQIQFNDWERAIIRQYAEDYKK